MNRASQDRFPSPLSPAGSSGLPKKHSSCPFVKPGKGCSTRVPASSQVPVFLPHEEESGECYAAQPDPAPCRHKPGRHRPRAGSLCSTSLPLHRCAGDPAGTVYRSLVKLALPSPPWWLLRTIRLGYAIQFTRRSPMFKGIRFNQGGRCPNLASGNRSLAGEGCDRASPPADMRSGFVSPYFIVPKKNGGFRPILDLRVLICALHKLPFKILT